MAKNNDLDEFGFEPVNDDLSEFGFEPEPSLEPETSATEAALRGAGQGLTFDTLDELIAAFKTSKGLSPRQEMTMPIEDVRAASKAETEAYEEELAKQRAAFEKAREDQPVAYYGSEIASGVLPALLTGGATAAARIGKEVVKGGVRGLAKGEGLKQAAKVGAGYGAASGFGVSEGETPQEVLGDVAMGAGLGAGLGVATPPVLKGLGKAASVVKQGTVDPILKGTEKAASIIPAIKESIASYKLTKAGKGVVGEKNYQEIIERSKDLVRNKLQPFLVNQDQDFSKAIGKIYKRVGDLGAKKDISKELSSIEKQVNNLLSEGKAPTEESRAVLGDLLNTINRTKKEMVVASPKKNVSSGVNSAINDLKKKQDKLEAINKEVGLTVKFTEPKIDLEKGIITTFESRTGTVISTPIKSGEFTPIGYKKVPSYDEFGVEDLKGLKSSAYEILEKAKKGDVGVAKKPIAKTYGLAKEGIEELAEQSNLKQALQESNKKMSQIRGLDDILPESLLKGDEKSVYKVAQFLRKGEIEGISWDELRDRLIHFADELTEIDPKFSKDLLKEAGDLAKRYELARTAKQSFGLNLGTGKAIGVWTGAGLGAARRGTGKVANKVAKLPDDGLQYVSKKLNESNNAGLQAMGRQLEEALQQEGPVKSALIWSLSQNPAFRKQVEKALPKLDEGLEKDLGIEPKMDLNTKRIIEAEDNADEAFGEDMYEGGMSEEIKEPSRAPAGVQERLPNIKEQEGYAKLVNGETTLGDRYDISKKGKRVKKSSDYGLYYDSEGYLTTGYGHKVTDAENPQDFMQMTEKGATELLERDVPKHDKEAISVLESFGIDPNGLSESQMDAINDMVFQLGATRARTFKNTFKLINEGKFEEAAKEAANSDWNRQTPKRVKDFQKRIVNPKEENELSNILSDKTLSTPEYDEVDMEEAIERVNSETNRVMKQKSSGADLPLSHLDDALGAIEDLPIDEIKKEVLQDKLVEAETYRDMENLKQLLETLKMS